MDNLTLLKEDLRVLIYRDLPETREDGVCAELIGYADADGLHVY